LIFFGERAFAVFSTGLERDERWCGVNDRPEIAVNDMNDRHPTQRVVTRDVIFCFWGKRAFDAFFFGKRKKDDGRIAPLSLSARQKRDHTTASRTKKRNFQS
jgi:hypothetical protein